VCKSYHSEESASNLKILICKPNYKNKLAIFSWAIYG
jgi:hypothetical protein